MDLRKNKITLKDLIDSRMIFIYEPVRIVLLDMIGHCRKTVADNFSDKKSDDFNPYMDYKVKRITSSYDSSKEMAYTVIEVTNYDR